MKKNLFIVAAVALMAMVSCNKEEINNNGAEQASDIVFVAEFDQEADTKIALGDLVDGIRKTTWVAGDEIKINGTVFSAKEAGDVTEFTTTSSFTETATYRAVYPAASYISTTAVEIPASQDGTFASASIAVAESSTTSLKFNNLVTILKFQVPVNCSKVTFESTASIAGRITVNYNDGVMTPNYAGVTQPNKTINVTGKFVPGTYYYVAVKPDTHTFTVKIDGNVSKVSTKAVKVERSQIRNMGVLPEPELIYLDVNSDWMSDNPRFAAYFFDPSDATNYVWVDLVETDTKNRYACSIPSGFTDVIFCRMKPDDSTNSWDQCYNQTHNLEVKKDHVFKISRSWDTYDTGVWMTMSGEVVSGLKSPWSVAGSFNSWGDQQLLTTSTDGLYVAKNLTLSDDASFKIKINDSWDVKYSFEKFQDIEPNKWMKVTSRGDDYNVYVTTGGNYDIYFNYPEKKLYVVTTGTSCSSATEQNTSPYIYLKPNSNWTQSNARFAVYFMTADKQESKAKWVSMTKCDWNENYYEVSVPSGQTWKYVIFCRMNPSASANNWNNKWNQTADLEIPTNGNNLYTVKDGTWDNGGGSWSNNNK